jgi:uncharacterized protein YciI
MRAWLAQVPEAGALLFCHPARPASGGPPALSADAIAAARQREWAYLAGDDFVRDLAAAGVTLVSNWPEPSLSRKSSGG